MDGPPETPRDPVFSTLHGERIEDPYRWLETSSSRVERFVDEQNAYADRWLDTPTREALRPAIEKLAETVEYDPVIPRPTGYFQRVKAPEQDHPVLYFRAELDDDRRELADPNEFSEDGSVSMDWYVPSHEGDLVAYGVTEGGSEQYDVRVLDIETGEIVEEIAEAGRTGPGMFAWTDDGFYYVATGSMADGGQLDKEIRHHELGGEETVLHTDIDAVTWPVLATDRESDACIVAFQEGWERTDLYRITDGDLDPLITDRDAIFEPRLYENTLYLRTSDDAPNYRLTAVDLDADDADDVRQRELVPEGEGILKSFALAENGLVTLSERNAIAEMAVYEFDGTHRKTVSMPGNGTVSGLAGTHRAPECFFRYQSFDRSPAIFRYDTESNERALLDAPDRALEIDLVVSQEWFEWTDGTDVPMFVVHRADLGRDGENPALLYGYGGFEISLTPTFDRFRLPFLRDGGVFAVANCRGGGEFGESWHHDARHGEKRNTFEDFIAAAGGLVEREYTRPERLGIMGGSNGGLTVGAALIQRPDLFRAAVCTVPVLDMLRFHTSLLGESWTSEYGSPDDPEAFEYIRNYSPYHNVEAREYPAILLKTAAQDSRVDPFHARKMAARLQRAQTGEQPILLRTNERTGHGVGKPTWKIVEETLDTWTFLYDRLGVEPSSEQL